MKLFIHNLKHSISTKNALRVIFLSAGFITIAWVWAIVLIYSI